MRRNKSGGALPGSCAWAWHKSCHLMMHFSGYFYHRYDALLTLPIKTHRLR